MMNLLFVDDDESSVADVKNHLERELESIKTSVIGFEGAPENIQSILPDIVILDLFEGPPADNQTTGSEVFDFVWDNHFCPIVVYSAEPDHVELKDHPFVEIVQKGRDSHHRVLRAVRSFSSHVNVLKEFQKDIQKSLSLSMRDIAPYAFREFTDEEKRNEAIKRSGRRRVAALMDGYAQGEKKLSSWEKYLFPPISQDTQLGDIMKRQDGNTEDPNSFSIVLTPSCDLVVSGGRTAKVKKVLVANCCSMEEGLALINMKNMGKSKLKERLPAELLTPGYNGPAISFPSLEGKIPMMVANLRDLELVPIEDIGFTEKKFIRIASIDSPFREMISWAYMQISCRPGLPDRDLVPWANEIADKVGS